MAGQESACTSGAPDLSLLAEAHSLVGLNCDRRGLVKDLQTIHNALAATWQLWLKRVMAPISVKLDAAFAGPGVAFDATIIRHAGKTGEMAVEFAGLDQFEQRAGWAGVQLYRQKVGLELKALRLGDAQRATALRYNGAFHSDRAFMRVVNAGQSHIVATLSEDAPWAMPAQQTYVSVESQDRRTLPDLLHVVQKTYAHLYPEYETGPLVAQIVGAISVEAFDEAWYGSIAQSDPVSAAQSLLNSAAFIASQHR